MHFDDLPDDEREVLALVDDWLSTTPEIFGDHDPDAIFDDDEEYMNFLFDSKETE